MIIVAMMLITISFCALFSNLARLRTKAEKVRDDKCWEEEKRLAKLFEE